VSAVRKKRIEVGKTIWIAVEFTNTGKTPADNAEVRGRLQKLPKGSPFDRNYTGRGFEIVSREHVNVGDTIAADFISQNDTQANVLTLDDLMQLTTDKSYVLAVHGIVRYHSTYIPSGVEETPFCYEFDPLTGEMVACRVVDAPKHSEMPSDTHTLERARFNIENRKIEMLDGGKRLRVEYEVVNRGRSAATITRTGDNLYVLQGLPEPPVFPDWKIETEVVHTGQAMVCELILHSIEAEKVRDFEARRSRLYVIGRIEYTDVFGKSHERGYVFAYDADAGTFYAPENATGYNYET
jgi:hypothetical protein